MTPRVFMYESRDTPEAQRFLGRFQASDGGQMPIFFTGATEAAARDKMTDWWAARRAEHAAEIARKTEARERAKARAAKKAEALSEGDIFS